MAGIERDESFLSLARQPRLWLRHVGLLGACIYIAIIAFPLPTALPLAILIAASVLSAAFGFRTNAGPTLKLPRLLVLLFLLATVAAIAMSVDIGRSLRFSVSLLPAVLLFLLVSESFSRIRDLSYLYTACTAMALGISVPLIFTASQYGFSFPADINFNKLVQWSPVLRSRNDLALLSLIAPLSVTLFIRSPKSAIGIVAGISVLLSLVTVVLFQSRGAMLAMLLAMGAVAFAFRTRFALAVFVGGLLLALVVDALLGFPLAQRIIELPDVLSRRFVARLVNWNIAWEMFRDSPVFGQGPHTYILFTEGKNIVVQVAWPHNLYLEVLGESGALGFLAFGSIVGYVAKVAWRVAAAADMEMRLFAVGASGSVCGFCLASVYELSFIREWVNLFLFLLVAIAARLSAHEPKNNSK